MATYYKFAERQADSFVNWAEIGKGLTDMLQEEVKIREQKKAAIDQATRDNLKRLGEAPTGNHTGANTWTLEYADNARQAILLQDRLLKSGALKLKDYTIMRQNLNDGTDELFSVMKNYQAVFKEKSDRLNSTDPKNRSQALEMDLLAYTEKFADFANSRAIIDPNNFMVNVGLMEPDPNNQGVMKLSKTIATTGFLKNIQDTKFDYFDADAAADVVAKRMGKYVRETIGKLSGLQGQVITKEGIINSEEYDGIVDTALKSFLSNPFNMTSILTDTLVEDKQGRPYVSNISGKEGNVIEYVFDPNTNLPTPKLTAEQESAVKEYMKEQIKFRLDNIEKVQVFNYPTPPKAEDRGPSGPPINVQQAYLSRVREKTGLSEKTFSNKRLETANNMKSILSKIPNGTKLSVELDKDPESGIINLKDGDNVIKSFYVYEPNAEIRKGYLNEFQEIISNLAGTDGMVDYLSRTGGIGQSGGSTPAP
jgi:hypothetical protein